jgi:hypothetical protein
MVMKELAGSNGEFFHAVNADTWLEDQRNDINQPFSDAFLTRKPLTRTRTVPLTKLRLAPKLELCLFRERCG